MPRYTIMKSDYTALDAALCYYDGIYKLIPSTVEAARAIKRFYSLYNVDMTEPDSAFEAWICVIQMIGHDRIDKFKKEKMNND